MKKFEWVDITTSDVCFKAFGKDLNELFANAGLALFEVIVNTKQIGFKISREIEVKGEDLQSLMFEWLNELIFYVDAENLAFSRFEVKIDPEKFTLKAKVFGEELDPDRHEIRTHVKAATYHKMEIKKNKLWSGQVILDI